MKETETERSKEEWTEVAFSKTEPDKLYINGKFVPMDNVDVD